jgi:hypothetical protein
MMAIAVVLPAPFGPNKATTSPASTRKSSLERARVSPKCFTIPFISTTGVTRRVSLRSGKVYITTERTDEGKIGQPNLLVGHTDPRPPVSLLQCVLSFDIINGGFGTHTCIADARLNSVANGP